MVLVRFVYFTRIGFRFCFSETCHIGFCFQPAIPSVEPAVASDEYQTVPVCSDLPSRLVALKKGSAATQQQSPKSSSTLYFPASSKMDFAAREQPRAPLIENDMPLPRQVDEPRHAERLQPRPEALADQQGFSDLPADISPALKFDEHWRLTVDATKVGTRRDTDLHIDELESLVMHKSKSKPNVGSLEQPTALESDLPIIYHPKHAISTYLKPEPQNEPYNVIKQQSEIHPPSYKLSTQPALIYPEDQYAVRERHSGMIYPDSKPEEQKLSENTLSDKIRAYIGSFVGKSKKLLTDFGEKFSNYTHFKDEQPTSERQLQGNVFESDTTFYSTEYKMKGSSLTAQESLSDHFERSNRFAVQSARTVRNCDSSEIKQHKELEKRDETTPLSSEKLSYVAASSMQPESVRKSSGEHKTEESTLSSFHPKSIIEQVQHSFNTYLSLPTNKTSVSSLPTKENSQTNKDKRSTTISRPVRKKISNAKSNADQPSTYILLSDKMTGTFSSGKSPLPLESFFESADTKLSSPKEMTSLDLISSKEFVTPKSSVSPLMFSIADKSSTLTGANIFSGVKSKISQHSVSSTVKGSSSPRTSYSTETTLKRSTDKTSAMTEEQIGMTTTSKESKLESGVMSTDGSRLTIVSKTVTAGKKSSQTSATGQEKTSRSRSLTSESQTGTTVISNRSHETALRSQHSEATNSKSTSSGNKSQKTKSTRKSSEETSISKHTSSATESGSSAQSTNSSKTTKTYVPEDTALKESENTRIDGSENPTTDASKILEADASKTTRTDATGLDSTATSASATESGSSAQSTNSSKTTKIYVPEDTALNESENTRIDGSENPTTDASKILEADASKTTRTDATGLDSIATSATRIRRSNSIKQESSENSTQPTSGTSENTSPSISARPKSMRGKRSVSELSDITEESFEQQANLSNYSTFESEVNRYDLSMDDSSITTGSLDLNSLRKAEKAVNNFLRDESAAMAASSCLSDPSVSSLDSSVSLSEVSEGGNVLFPSARCTKARWHQPTLGHGCHKYDTVLHVITYKVHAPKPLKRKKDFPVSSKSGSPKSNYPGIALRFWICLLCSLCIGLAAAYFILNGLYATDGASYDLFYVCLLDLFFLLFLVMPITGWLVHYSYVSLVRMKQVFIH